ncbi:MAG TPA: chromate transporter [Chloroflexota bacterium]|nr:chromate transporter [Chloroflexota bacterium]
MISLDRLLALLFTANVATFGSGLATVPLLERTLVQDTDSLTLDQFLFAFTVGRVTPGPANLWVAGLGYMLYGLTGGLLSAAVVMLPGYAIVPLSAGYRRLEHLSGVRGFSRGLTAAVVGVMLATAAGIGRTTLTSVHAVLVCALTLTLLHRLRWNPLLAVVTGAAVAAALNALSG